MFFICKYSEGINTKLYLHIKQSIDLEKDHFLSWLYIPDFCRFFISMYQEGTIPALQDQLYIIFYHGYIYRISVCFVSPSTVMV